MRSEPPTGDELTRLLVSMKRNVLEQVASEPAPTKRSLSMNRVVGLGLGLTLLLGLGAGAAFALGVMPTPSGNPAAHTTTPTPRPTSSPPPVEYVAGPRQPVSDNAVGEDPASSGGLDSESAYELCVSAVGHGVRSSGGSFDVAPFDEAEVIEREDGRFYVWAEFSNTTLSPELQDLGAAHCIIGGSVDSPEWVVKGEAHRDYRELFDPNQPVEDYRE